MLPKLCRIRLKSHLYGVDGVNFEAKKLKGKSGALVADVAGDDVALNRKDPLGSILSHRGMRNRPPEQSVANKQRRKMIFLQRRQFYQSRIKVPFEVSELMFVL